ncbi:MerR family transcriptional regulator [Plantactinospora sp. GCM10030261]|uniref:MerR family transcriptional regulator n=1 Tax=Plantactinospora sp. GCM10030261 TaxID=3273420 RepID=UPI003608EA15
MRIGELARRTDTTERSLRYYEEQDLLRPARRASGYREYAEDDVRVVRAIRMLLAAGLNTATIAEVLTCMTDDGEVLVPACVGLAPVLVRERRRIDATIDELLAARRLLDDIIEVAAQAPPTPPACDERVQ